MNFYFFDANGVKNALLETAPELGVVLCEREDAEVCVRVREQSEDGLSVSLDGKTAEISYGGGISRFLRAFSMLADWIRGGKRKESVRETTLFLRNGPMLDVSRNAVLNVATAKWVLRKIALMGMSTCMLYTEDTYEVEGYPYFGYMRGKYTKAELRELDAYACMLGIELIPCIQVLGHLATALRWADTASYRDTVGVLLVGAEETYRLIDEMMKTLEECFTTRRVHIGMDETHSLGTGASMTRYGYRPQEDLYLEHLARVTEIVHAHGFSPMMWSDMFFRLSGKAVEGFEDYDYRVTVSDEVAAMVPKGVAQVYWDYYHEDEDFYAKTLEKHRKLGDEIIFAGGVWLWSGHTPLFDQSLRNTVPALDACRKAGVREVLATVWLNGGEGLFPLSLAGLAWYADYGYTGRYDEESVKRCFRAACLSSYDDFFKLIKTAYPHGGRYPFSRALFYNDPMTGLMDAHVTGLDTRAYYRAVTAELDGLSPAKEFALAFAVNRAFSSVLEEKADFGVRLKAAYDKGDRSSLAELAKECKLIAEKLILLRDVHRAAWMSYYKPHGFEIMDGRYGALRARMESAAVRIEDYLAGRVAALEELEESRMRFDCRRDAETRDGEIFNWYGFSAIFSAGVY